jgi:integrase
MTPRLRAAVQAHAARFRLSQRSPFLFTQEMTRRSAVAGERVRSFRGAFARAVKKTKLPAGFRPHDLRHRRVTTWLAAGKSPVLVQSAMGHSSITTTMSYSHLQAEHLRALVEEQASSAAPAKEASR